MSEYKLDITGTVGINDYGNINDYMAIIDNDDRLTITVDSTNMENIADICKLIEDKGFVITSKDDSSKDKYSIIAHRIT